MSGVQSDYVITQGAGFYSISDNVAGRDGLDTLYEVERIGFSDGTVRDLTAAAPAADAALEILSRPPDAADARAGDMPLTLPDPWSPWHDF